MNSIITQLDYHTTRLRSFAFLQLIMYFWQNSWKLIACSNSYEPVINILELMGRQNPELSVSRESIQLALGGLRSYLVGRCFISKGSRLSSMVAGRLRWDLVQPEVTQLMELQSGNQLSLFDVLGRSRYSLRTTRLSLLILQKTLLGEAMNAHLSAGVPGSAHLSTGNATEQDFASFVGKLVTLFVKMEQEVDRMDSWFQSGSQMLRRFSLFGRRG